MLEVLHLRHVATVPTVPTVHKHLNKIILSKGKKKIMVLTVIWVKQEHLSGDNVPKGVAIAWDLPYVTSQTLPPLPRLFEQSGRPRSRQSQQKKPKKN